MTYKYFPYQRIRAITGRGFIKPVYGVATLLLIVITGILLGFMRSQKPPADIIAPTTAIKLQTAPPEIPFTDIT